MQATDSSETSVLLCKTTRRHITEDCNFYIHRLQKLERLNVKTQTKLIIIHTPKD